MSGDASVGLWLVDKPEGPTSHDIVDRVRRTLGVRRVGHTGTLDPFATGLLILCVGWATRLAQWVSELPKRYRATMRLGTRTDTDDRTGRVRSRDGGWALLDRDAIETALHERAEIRDQRVPAFSARRHGGTRLYEAARRGLDVEPPVTAVRIYRIQLLDLSGPDVTFEVECSAGTYVRAFARDVGSDLGVGAHLTALRRLEIGAFRVEDALPAERLGDRAALERALRPPRDAVAHLPWVELDEAAWQRVRHGQPVAAPVELWGADRVAIGFKGRLVGVATIGDGALLPRKVFAHA